MKVRDAMSRDVHTIREDETAQAAAQVMAEVEARVLVVGSPGEPRGILTDRDLLIRVVAQGRDPTAVRVAEVMSSTLFGCREDAPLAEARAEMERRQIRRLLVRDDDGRVVGLVGLDDAGRAEAGP